MQLTLSRLMVVLSCTMVGDLTTIEKERGEGLQLGSG